MTHLQQERLELCSKMDELTEVCDRLCDLYTSKTERNTTRTINAQYDASVNEGQEMTTSCTPAFPPEIQPEKQEIASTISRS